MKKDTWIVVANSTLARVFTLDGVELKEQDAMVHPENRLHEKELTSDRQGGKGSITGNGRYKLEQKHTPKKNEMTLFAKQIAGHIEGARKGGTLENLYLVASPTLLGLIRSEFSTQTQDLIIAQADKDLTHCNTKEIYEWYTAQKF